MKINKSKYFIFFIAVLMLNSCNTNEINKITIDKSAVNLILGQVDSLFANVEYTGDIIPAITWTSSKSDVVKVTNGEIRALKKGNSVITAQAGNKTSTCTVTVNNEIFPVLSKGEIWYFGDVYNSGTSNNFLVCLAGNDINMDNLSGTDDVMFLEFNTELTVTNNVPTGIYEISENFQPKTMVPGWTETNGNPWGTWFFGSTNNDVVDGFVKVTNTNNTNYKFELNLTDFFGNVITGNYQMNLPFFDLTVKQNLQIMKSKKIKNSGNFILKNNLVKKNIQ